MQITRKKPSILIYQDYVHNNGQLYHALVERYGFAAVGYCDAAGIIAGMLDPTVGLFVMPGGADLYYCEKLNGAGNRAIRNFVENGGAYLGICAGAYYACDTIDWAKGTAQEISGTRELKLYSGHATGPVANYIQGLDQSWLGAATITMNDASHTVCYRAGPVFSEPSADTESVLARYSALPGQPPAIVESRIGKGKAILSSPHIEELMPSLWSGLYTHSNPHYDHAHKTLKTLSRDSAHQTALLHTILDRLITAKTPVVTTERAHVA